MSASFFCGGRAVKWGIIISTAKSDIPFVLAYAKPQNYSLPENSSSTSAALQVGFSFNLLANFRKASSTVPPQPRRSSFCARICQKLLQVKHAIILEERQASAGKFSQDPDLMRKSFYLMPPCRAGTGETSQKLQIKGLQKE